MKPPRRRRPWIRRLLLAAVTISVVGVGLRSETASRFASRFVERVAEAFLGEQVTLGRVQVEFFPPAVTVEGLVIAHPPTGETIAAARSITLALGFDGLRPRLGRVVLDRPLVELHLDDDGLREFRGIRRSEAPSEPLAELPWEELVVRDGSFRVHAGDTHVLVEGIGLTPSGPAGAADLVLGRVELALPATTQVATDVQFPGLRIAADRVDVPSLDVQFPAFGLDGSLALPFSGPVGGALSARVELAKLTAPATPLSPWVDGVVHADAELGGTLAAMEARGVLAVSGFALWQLDGDHLEAVTFGDLVGPWSVAPGPTGYQLLVDHARMVWGPGTLDVTAAVGLEDKTVTAAVLAEGVSLAEILRSTAVAPTPWVDFTADLETHVTGSWSPFRLEGPFEVDLTELEVGDGPVHARHDTLLHIPRGSVGGSLVVDARHLVLDARSVRAGPSHGRALADIGFGPQGPLILDASLPELHLAWLAPLGDIGLDGVASVEARLSGPYDALGVDGVVSATSFVVLGLPVADTLTAHVSSDMRILEFDSIDARLGDSTWTGGYLIDFSRDNHMEALVDLADARVRDLTNIFVDLEGIDGATSGRIELVGTPYDLSGETRLTLADVDLYGERFSEGEALAWMDHGELILDHLEVRRPTSTGVAMLQARGSVRRGWAMNVEVLSDGLTLEGSDLVTPLGAPVRGDVVIDARVGGTLFDWRPEGRLALRRTRYGGEPLADTTIAFETIEVSPGVSGIAFRGEVLGPAAQVAGTLEMYDRQRYDVQFELDHFPLQFLRPRGEDGSPIVAEVSGGLDLGGFIGDSPTPVDIEGNLEQVRLAWSGHELVNDGGRAWRFSVHDKAVDIPLLELSGNDDTRLALSGRIAEGGQVELTAKGALDVDLARAVLPGILEASGMVDVDLRMKPAEGRSDVEVRADLRRVDVRTEWWPDTFEELEGSVVARPDGYTFEGIRARSGGGTLVGETSRIDADDWAPVAYDLGARLEDARVRYLDYLPPIRGSADLSFEGPAADPLLSGEIRIADMEFRDRVDWEAMVISLREERLTASAPEASADYFSMDLHVLAEDTVRLRNNVADAGASADLRIIGDTARPGMLGTIRVDPGGSVYLHEREFEVSRGEIRYLDPYTFDPDLDIQLETDISSAEQEYHVNYGVSGLFSDWTTTTTADPYLSQADINAFLLFGVTREELERYGGQALGTALVAETGDLLLGQTALTRANPIIDRWSLVSGVSERGSTTVSSDLRLVAEKELGEFDLTLETSLGQGVGQDWYASVERRIARRLYATMYAATRQEGRSLPIGAAYGAEFKFRWELD